MNEKLDRLIELARQLPINLHADWLGLVLDCIATLAQCQDELADLREKLAAVEALLSDASAIMMVAIQWRTEQDKAAIIGNEASDG